MKLWRVRPKWWQWWNPRAWRRARAVEVFVHYNWDMMTDEQRVAVITKVLADAKHRPTMTPAEFATWLRTLRP